MNPLRLPQKVTAGLRLEEGPRAGICPPCSPGAWGLVGVLQAVGESSPGHKGAQEGQWGALRCDHSPGDQPTPLASSPAP